MTVRLAAAWLFLVLMDGRAAAAPDTAERWLALGEQQFADGHIEDALRSYRQVERFPHSATLAYAVYRQGWCHLNADRPEDAISAFERAIALSAAGVGGPTQGPLLRREARKDLVTAYAASRRPPEKAAEYFQRIGGTDSGALLERLANRYRENGQAQASAQSFRELIARDVHSPRLCEWQLGVLRAVLAGGTLTDQIAELQRLGAVATRIESTPGVSADVVAACRKQHHDTAKELAVVWHKRAQRDKDLDLYAATDPVYREFLSRYQREPDGYDMAFRHAEVLWVLESWDEAAEAYTDVVERDTKGKYAKDAAYAAVLARKNALAAEEAAAPPQRDRRDVTPRPLSPATVQLLDAMDRYVRVVPDDDRAPAVMYRRGRTLYEHNQFGEAAPVFLQVTERYPGHELAIYAANLYLDSLNALGRPRELCDRAQRFRDKLGTRDAEFGRQMKRLVDDCARRGVRR